MIIKMIVDQTPTVNNLAEELHFHIAIPQPDYSQVFGQCFCIVQKQDTLLDMAQSHNIFLSAWRCQLTLEGAFELARHYHFDTHLLHPLLIQLRQIIIFLHSIK